MSYYNLFPANDNNDAFDTNSTFRWFVLVMLVLVSIGVFILVGFGIHNYPVKHTNVGDPGNPGTLESDRYGFNWILIMLTVVAHMLALVSMFSGVLWRTHYGCSMVWLVLYFVACVMIVVMIGLMGAQYADCNNPMSPDNMCNDLRWDYLHTPCPGVDLSTLSPNPAFLWIFWTGATIAILHLIFVVGTVATIMSQPSVEQEDVYVKPSAPNNNNSVFGVDNDVRRRNVN